MTAPPSVTASRAVDLVQAAEVVVEEGRHQRERDSLDQCAAVALSTERDRVLDHAGLANPHYVGQNGRPRCGTGERQPSRRLPGHRERPAAGVGDREVGRARLGQLPSQADGELSG
jgi:hypothetical protein